MALNVMGLALGLGVWFATGQIVDLHNILFPFSVSRVGIMLDQLRLSGFQIEPGTYSNLIYFLVLARALLRKRLFNLFDLLALVSTLATFAAWAVIGVAFYVVGCLIEFFVFNRAVARPIRLSAIAVCGVICLFVVPIILPSLADLDYIQYIQNRFSGETGSGSAQFKSEALEAWQASLGLDMLLGHALPDTFCYYCLSVQDLGTGFNMVYYFGIVPTLLIVEYNIVRTASVFSIMYMIAALPLAVTKFYCYDPIFWLVIGLMMFAGSPLVRGGRVKSFGLPLAGPVSQ